MLKILLFINYMNLEWVFYFSKTGIIFGKWKYLNNFLFFNNSGNNKKMKYYTTFLKQNENVENQNKDKEELLGMFINDFNKIMIDFNSLMEKKFLLKKMNSLDELEEILKDMKELEPKKTLFYNKLKFMENSFSHKKMVNYLMNEKNEIVIIWSELTTSKQGMYYPCDDKKIGVLKVKEFTDLSYYMSNSKTCMHFKNMEELENFFSELNENDYKGNSLDQMDMKVLLNFIMKNSWNGKQLVYNMKTNKLEEMDFTNMKNMDMIESKDQFMKNMKEDLTNDLYKNVTNEYINKKTFNDKD